jgi:hypothetical protein
VRRQGQAPLISAGAVPGMVTNDMKGSEVGRMNENITGKNSKYT